MMTGRNLKGAREWLKESDVHYIGSHDSEEDSSEGSLKIVDELYENGATKVEVDIWDEANDFADILVVTFPEDVEKSIKVLSYLGELFADDVTEKDRVVIDFNNYFNTIEWVDA